MPKAHGYLLAVAFGLRALAADTNFPVHVNVAADRPLGELKPFWRMFGADEPNYATLPNGRKLLSELGALKPHQVYVRAHNLLCSGDGTPSLKWGSTGVYSEDANGNPIYQWAILDSIFDAYLKNGVRPYAQIGFMPQALSTHPEPYQHHWQPGNPYGDIFTGWAYPPRDYNKWRELVFQWVSHCVARYGRPEVESWYWEVWNEPNIGYWKSTAEEFCKLQDYAVDGVRRALPTARVGGPDSAGPGGRWTEHFLEHCLHGTNYATGTIGTPIDFFSFHAKGSPGFTNGHVRMGIANELRAVDSGFKLIRQYPELRKTPIVIGECDPDGCAACQGAQLGYRNTTMYSSYTAASFARIWELARRDEANLDAALTWAFTFADQPAFAGFRQLASAGLDLPVLNVFRMFSYMNGKQLATSSDGEVSLEDMQRHGVRNQPDVSALACADSNGLGILVWHYHDDDVAGPAAEITLRVTGLPAAHGKAKLSHYRIDADHSNAYEAWKRIGSPAQISKEQFAKLEKAGQLALLKAPSSLRLHAGEVELKFVLPRQAVSLLRLEWQ